LRRWLETKMTTLNDTQLLERIHSLPPEKQVEVRDFVDFLAARAGIAQPRAGLPAIDDLVGGLAWQGDPVEFQRSLRDEWN